MKKILIACAVLLLLVVGIVAGRPFYREWKQKRFIAQAQGFLAKSDYRNAALSARQALELKPRNLEACRIMAQVADTLRSPLSISWRQRIVDLEPERMQNRLDLAQSALLQGNYTQAEQALRGVDKAGQVSVAYHQLSAMVAMAQNNIAEADWHFGQAAKLEPENKMVQFNEAVIHLQAKNEELVAEARKSLERLYADPTYRKDALRHLAMAAVRNKDFARAEAFSQELQADPKASFEDRVLHLSVLKDTASAELETYLAALKQEAVTNTESIYTLSSWLIAHRRTDEAVKWLAELPANLQSQPPVRMALADGYAARADWPALQTFLQEQNWAELDFIRLAQLARASREQRETIATQANWQAAVRAAAGRLKALTALARLAGAWGFEKEKEELLWTIVEKFPGERWALQSLDQFYLTTGHTRGLQRVYVTLVSFDANDVAAKNNLAIVSLLLNMQLTQAHDLAREVYDKYPQQEVFASTYAYSLHLQGKTKEGLKVLEALKPGQLENPGIAAYYGVLLAASGEPEKAKKYLAIAENARLLPEEKKLIITAKETL